MSDRTSIEWADASWNPVTGCTKVSQGCKNCYAERLAPLLKARGNPSYANGFQVTTHERILPLPTTWRRHRNIFVNSMSDLFHEQVPDDFIRRVFDVMVHCPQHTFMVLTKRPQEALRLASSLPWPPHLLMGVSVESADHTDRIDALRQLPACRRFLSMEPLLGAVPDLDLSGIHWLIAGGESGPGARPMREEWVTDLRDQCQAARIPFLFKQWGGTNKKKTGRLLQGRTWDQFPNSPSPQMRLA